MGGNIMAEKASIYLAGPMSGLTWRQALAWRKVVEAELSSRWRLINPVRAQVPEERMDDIIPCPTQKNRKKVDLWVTATGVTAQDEFFIDQSDWILAHFLGAEIVSIGTVWEMGYGWANNKKIITVLEPESIHDHGFVRRRSHVFTPSLDEAIQFFKAIAL
jgi:nucleoside 2-deoxyribosyltransferase